MKGKRIHPRLALIGIFLLFFVPIWIAWIMNLNADKWRPSQTTNHGTLVVPARPVKASGLTGLDGQSISARFLHGKWTLAFFGASPCDEICQAALYKIRQSRLAQGKDIDRVQRLYVLTSPPDPTDLAELQQLHAGLRVASAPPRWFGHFSVDGKDVVHAGQIYLIDPQGYFMMFYEANANANGIVEDLERLLKVSKIG